MEVSAATHRRLLAIFTPNTSFVVSRFRAPRLSGRHHQETPMRSFPMLCLLSLIAACGGKSSAARPAEPAGHDHHEHAGEAPHAHGEAGGPVASFHDLLSPLWHAAEGPQRVTDTCDKAGQLHGLAQAMVDAGAPAGAKPDFMTAAAALVTACADLHAECETPERTAFADKFHTVHEAFHAVAEQLGE
jgi:hypothetical protein